MSAGGINAQPLVGMQPTVVGAVPQAVGAQPQLAPVAGQQAGTVAPSGGLVDDGLPRTAAIGAHVVTNGFADASAASSAAASVAGAPVVDAAAVQAGTNAVRAGATGPAAWDESWAKRFKDAGAPAEIIQQLTFTGAMGADAAQLEQMLQQVTGEIDTQLAKFAHDHPEAFRKLRSNPKVDRSMLAQIAAGVNAGQVPKDQLDQMVDTIGKSQGRAIFDMFVKPMIVWSLIPGWGAIRLGFAPFTGGKDILTGEKMFGDPMSTAFTIMAGVGGSITLFNHARGAMQVAQGHRLVAAGGDAARIAAAEGFQTLSTFDKVKSFLPGTNANRVFAGVSRLDQNLTQGISHLKGVERELAENVINKWRAGEVSILGDPASKWTKMGFQPNARGILMGRNKPMVGIGTNRPIPTITLDGRMTGKTLAAHLASIGVDFADDTVANNGLRQRALAAFGTDAAALKLAREHTLGTATQQLLDAGHIAKPNGIQKLFGAVRPGPLQDALWAADNVGAGTLGKLHGTAGIPKGIKWGVGGLLAAGAGYFMMVKMPADAAKKQQEEAAKAQQAAGQPQAGQPSPALQAALQQFAAMPKEQQSQLLQQQYATIQQASQQPNLTAEQQGQLQQAMVELQLFVEVANGGASTATGGGAGMSSPGVGAAAAAASSTTAASGGFSARGLGLAP